MITKEENERLTRVGPGTPGGEMLRRYWWPVAFSDALKGPRPTAVRVLGEDFVLFRDGKGRPGLLEPQCAHRRVALARGRVESEGVRCCFHGWLWDVEGRCLEQPCEPPESDFRDKIPDEVLSRAGRRRTCLRLYRAAARTASAALRPPRPRGRHAFRLGLHRLVQLAAIGGAGGRSLASELAPCRALSDLRGEADEGRDCAHAARLRLLARGAGGGKPQPRLGHLPRAQPIRLGARRAGDGRAAEPALPHARGRHAHRQFLYHLLSDARSQVRAADRDAVRAVGPRPLDQDRARRLSRGR